MELQSILARLEANQIALFAISYDSAETLSNFSERNGITYPLLADEGSQVIRALGLLDEDLESHHAEFGGSVRNEQRGVCYPGVFLLNEQGVVSERRFQRNYRVRESGSSLLERALSIGANPERDASPVSNENRVQVRAALDSPTVWRYQRLNVVVDVLIVPGLHLYARPIPDGYTPVTIEVSAPGVEVGEMTWPPAERFILEGLDEEFWVYTGSIRMLIPIEFVYQRGEEQGQRPIQVRVSYQACNDTTCFPPTEQIFDLVAVERAGVD